MLAKSSFYNTISLSIYLLQEALKPITNEALASDNYWLEKVVKYR